MAGQIRLFEKTAAGLLVEVDPAEAAALRAARRFTHMSISADVLLTSEEEAARRAEEAEAEAEMLTKLAAKEKRTEDRDKAEAKLTRLGLSAEEIAALTGR